MTNLSDADLAEIEAVAKAADSRHRWKLLDHSHLEAGCRCLSCHDPATVWQTSNMLDCEDVPRTSDEQERCETAGYTFADAAHIARMDPATTLALLADLDAAEGAIARHGACFCRYDDGPEETCPIHGRSYAEWIERADAVSAREVKLREDVARVRKLHERVETEDGPVCIACSEHYDWPCPTLAALDADAAAGGES